MNNITFCEEKYARHKNGGISEVESKTTFTLSLIQENIYVRYVNL